MCFEFWSIIYRIYFYFLLYIQSQNRCVERLKPLNLYFWGDARPRTSGKQVNKTPETPESEKQRQQQGWGWRSPSDQPNSNSRTKGCFVVLLIFSDPCRLVHSSLWSCRTICVLWLSGGAGIILYKRPWISWVNRHCSLCLRRKSRLLHPAPGSSFGRWDLGQI